MALSNPSPLPYWLQRDLAVLKSDEDIRNIIVEVHDSESQPEISFTFDISYSYAYAKAVDDRIKLPETIQLRYNVSYYVTAPRVYATREHFPRDIPHLNITPVGSAASLCLWQSGTADLYLQHGVKKLVDVLKHWLSDARSGSLQDNGWEPQPVTSHIYIQCDTEKFQHHAHSNSGAALRGKAFIFINEKINSIFIIARDVPKSSISSKSKFKLESDQILHFFISDCDTENTKFYNTPFECIDDILSISSNDACRETIKRITTDLTRKTYHKCILTICLKRPKNINAQAFVSSDLEEGKVEIISFLIEKNQRPKRCKVVGIATHKLLSSISGITPPRELINIVGCGAVGSALAVSLARCGCKIGTLWDEDIFLPHNNARHELESATYKAFLNDKSLMLYNKLITISPRNAETARPMFKFFSNDNLSTEYIQGHILDTTGGRHLDSTWISNPAFQIHKVFLADSGRVAILQSQAHQLSQSDLADMLDLEAQLLLYSCRDSDVSNWLNSETNLSDKLLGFGCGSSTMEMPWFIIQTHCNALIPKILSAIGTNKSSVTVSKLNSDSTSLSQIEIEIPYYYRSVVDDNRSNQWTVTYSTEVMNAAKSARHTALPNECGGFIIGLMNLEEFRMSVVHVTKSVVCASPIRVSISSIYQDEYAMHILNRSNNMLQILGTWHTHTSSSSNISSVDSETLRNEAKNSSMPILMMILSDAGFNSYIQLPSMWI